MFISSGTVAANSIQKGCAVCVLKVQRKPKRSRACYQHSWARAVTKTKGGEVKIAAGIKKRSRSQQRRLNNRQWREFVTLFFHASLFVMFSWRVRRRSSREAKTHSSALFRISSPCVCRLTARTWWEAPGNAERRLRYWKSDYLNDSYMDRKARDNALCTVADGTMEPTRGEQKYTWFLWNIIFWKSFLKTKKLLSSQCNLYCLFWLVFCSWCRNARLIMIKLTC